MLLTIIREAARCYLVFTLAATGLAKLSSWRIVATGVRLENVIPRRMALPIIIAVAITELTLSTFLATDFHPMISGAATAGLLFCFGGYKVAVAARTGNLACSCAGPGIAYKATRPGVLATVAAAITQAALAVSWAIIPSSPNRIFGVFALLAFSIPVAAFLAGFYRSRTRDPGSPVQEGLTSVRVSADS